MRDCRDDHHEADRALESALDAMQQRTARMRSLLARADGSLGVRFGDIEGLLALTSASREPSLMRRLLASSKRVLRFA
jgi:hypothetical protein